MYVEWGVLKSTGVRKKLLLNPRGQSLPSLPANKLVQLASETLINLKVGKVDPVPACLESMLASTPNNRSKLAQLTIQLFGRQRRILCR